MQQQIWGEVVDFNLAFFSSSENVTVKTLLKSVHIYQSYCKKNLAQFFGPPCISPRCVQTVTLVYSVNVGHWTRITLLARIPTTDSAWILAVSVRVTVPIPENLPHVRIDYHRFIAPNLLTPTIGQSFRHWYKGNNFRQRVGPRSSWLNVVGSTTYVK